MSFDFAINSLRDLFYAMCLLWDSFYWSTKLRKYAEKDKYLHNKECAKVINWHFRKEKV